MRGAVLALCLCLPSLAQAADRVQALISAMRAPEVMAVMEREGLEYGASLDQDMLEGQGGDWFRGRVEQINAAARLEDALRDGIRAEMSDAQIDAALAFFQAPLGQRIAALEASAREAFLDEAVTAAAEAVYDRMKTEGGARFEAVERFIEANDLIGLNVKGEMGSTYQFYRGLVDGKAFVLSEAEILEEISLQTEEIGKSAERWIFSYLIMAYGPLKDTELELYIAFSESADGQALNRALFAGFDAVFDAINYDLGRAVARAMTAHDL